MRRFVSFTRTRSSGRRCQSTDAKATAAHAGKVDWLGVAVFGSISLATLGLGVWQVQRYYEKVASINEKTGSLKETPLLLPPSASQQQFADAIREVRGKVVSLKGKFLHDKEIRLGLRTAPPNLLSAKAQGLATNPQGYYIITPFVLSDNSIVFVNRGWVSMGAKDWSKPLESLSLTVLVNGCEKPTYFSPKNDPRSKTLLWLEDASLVLASGIALPPNEVVAVECVEMDDNAVIKSYPAMNKSKTISQSFVTPETHVAYAFTWFSLFAFGVVGTYYRFSTSKILPVLKKGVEKNL